MRMSKRDKFQVSVLNAETSARAASPLRAARPAETDPLKKCAIRLPRFSSPRRGYHAGP
jgi:hypothetical protein